MKEISIEDFYSPASQAASTPKEISVDEFFNQAPAEALPQAEEPSFLSKAKEFGQNVVGKIGEAAKATGQAIKGKNEFDYPEFSPAPESLAKAGIKPDSLGKLLKLQGGYLTEPSEEGRVAIIKNALPQAQFSRDKFGNIITDIDGKKFYLNRSGLSGRDIKDLGTEVVKYLPAARGAYVATAGMSTAAKAAAQAFGAGVTSLASQQAATVLGSNDPVKIGEAAVMAGLGAGAELAAPVLSAIGNAVTKKLAGGKLTKAEREEILSIGLDPDTLSEETLNKALQAKGATPEARKTFVESASLPEPVPLTTGEITSNPALQRIETEGQKGSFGELAQREMAAFRQKQQDAIQNNVEILQKRFAGEARSGEEIGQELQEKLTSLRQTKRKEVADAYESAMSAKAFLPADSLGNIKRSMEAALNREGVDIAGIAPVKRFFTRMENLEKIGGKNANVLPKVKLIEGIRKNINANIAASSDPVTRRAGNIMKNELDGIVDNYIEGGLMTGEQSAIDQIRKARDLHRNFKQAFDSKDIVKTLTETRGIGDSRLKVDAANAVNLLFGKNAISKGSVTSDVKKLKEILPTEDFGLLKQAGLLKILGKQKQGSFSGVKFANNLEQVLKENPQMMKELYSPEEIKALETFARVARRATTRDYGGENFSNTAATAFNLLEAYFGNAGRLLSGLTRQFGKKAGNAVQERRVIESIKGAVPKRPSSRAAGAGAGLNAIEATTKE